VADQLSEIERSALMGRVRGKDTKPELVVRRAAHRLGYRFRLHRKGLPGMPDLIFPSRRKAIFVHGCWWHRHEGCVKAAPVKTRADFWDAKFARNVARDAKVEADLRAAGWGVAIIWECQTRRVNEIEDTLRAFLGPPGNAEST
jgi:DNA mismatch endonuclease (patch repair protein)